MLGRFILAGVLLAAVGLPFHLDSERIELSDEIRRDMPGRFVTLRHGVTHYDLTGPKDGELVVLVHGFSMPAFMWGRLPGILGDAGYRVLRYDLYGRGLSDRPEVSYGPGLFRDQLGDLLRVLRITQPFHLIGLSMGGAIAVDLAATPGKFRLASLTLMAPAGFPMDKPAATALLELPWIGEYLMRVAGERALMASIERSVADPALVPQLQASYRQQMKYFGFKRAILSTLRDMPLESSARQYRAVGARGTPTLVLWGGADRVVPAENAEYVRLAIPAAQVQVVEGVGHLLPYERPAVTGPLVTHFLHQHPAAKVAEPASSLPRKKRRGRR